MTQPYRVQGRIFNAASASTTTELYSVKPDFPICRSIFLEVIGAAFSGTLDFQGKVTEFGTYTNLDYYQVWQPGPAALSVAQISLTTDSTRRFYVIPFAPPYVQIVMTLTAGTVTIDATGYDEPAGVPMHIQGFAAHDTASTGNPVLLGAEMDDTSPDTVDEGDVGKLRISSRRKLHIIPYVTGGDGETPTHANRASGDAQTLPTGAGESFAIMVAHNGSTGDKWKNNTEATALASESDTQSTRTSSDLTNHNARGIIVHLKTSNKVGTTATYTPSLQAKFTGGDYATIWTAAAAVTTATDSTYVLYPGASGGNVTEVDGIPIPRTFRVVVTVASADTDNNMDTLVDYSLIL